MWVTFGVTIGLPSDACAQMSASRTDIASINFKVIVSPNECGIVIYGHIATNALRSRVRIRDRKVPNST